ncbi:MAG: helicase-exonuclease AddAB subunit AddA [Lachnospiraceae bacterium]|nr:helicase-exonuclease AddAB subunit AddA [Lachnospiraceae bacterium]
MGVSWTKEQQQVIDLRDRNILVSAAAGSGKTAVLVERILSMVTDPKHPMDIDELLVVTFTRAAAGEMRERIGNALEMRLLDDPDNEHLQKQTTLVHKAQISTIHGFCTQVIRNYFHTIDLDPGFRMADEGELKLLLTDVAKQVLEEAYEERQGDFLDFIEFYSTGKTDDGIESMIIDLYNFAVSDPWPEEWLEKCRDIYALETWEEMEEQDWMQFMWRDVEETLSEVLILARSNVELARQPGGPAFYHPMMESDLELAEGLQEAGHDFDALYHQLKKLPYAKLSSKKADGEQPEKRALAADNRARIKAMLGELQKRYFYASSDTVLSYMKGCAGPVRMLITLTLRFMERLQEEKRDKNILDFSDLEHYALQILVKKEGETYHLNQAAKDLANTYKEVLIDEYQDSNLVQELLLTHVSRMIFGEYNVFMVGDVKQSIYRFRQARPELFMEKYKRYTKTDSTEQRISLHKNFRSRGQVLDSVNYFFRQLMRPELGGIDYDDEAALYTGAHYPEGNREEFARTEVLMIEMDGGDDLLDDKGSENAKELEARAIARRIGEIVGREKIWDGILGAYREVRYSDCVILLRTMSGWAETFGRILNQQGIPAYSTSKTGYFSAVEVVTILNYLHICDNPRQDIPFTAVLASPIAWLTAQELAELKCRSKEHKLYENVLELLEHPTDSALYEKVKTFYQLYQEVRERVVYAPIHEVIWYIIQKTGYGDYVSVLPGGEQRMANLRMLVEKAMDYEKTSYGGLFNFIRYIESLQKYNVDFGEVNVVGENENTVRIMSIHKSKGLEFPVVFVGGMSKRFNQQDLNKEVIAHPQYGISSTYVNYKDRVKAPTLMKMILRQSLKQENLGEELRVLYVAMTRAKEKLILTGTISNLDKKLAEYGSVRCRREEPLSLTMLSEASCYWSWILPALMRAEGKVDILQRRIAPEDLVVEEIAHETSHALAREALLHWDCEQIYDEAMHETLQERFAYAYPFHKQRDIPVKASVSELKKQSMQDEETFDYYKEEPITPCIPKFLQESQQSLSGAGRGTVYHKFMELLDYAQVAHEEQLAAQIEQLVQKGRMQEEETHCIQLQDFQLFVKGPLGKRMGAAQAAHQLYREQPFVLGVPANTMRPEWSQSETILVQGIIDAFFYEGENIVLVDYKTDRVGPEGGQELVEKYHVQLEYYAEALERLTGKTVSEKIIYSFTLGESIQV